MKERIVANAEVFRKVARENIGVELSYDEASVKWLDGYIDRQRVAQTEEVKKKLPNTLGSFLGECIRHTYGGEWCFDERHGWCVKINEKISVFPFAKVQKQLAGEDGESVFGLFNAIAPLLAMPPQPDDKV
jgi:hypothetical protein